MTLSRTVSLVAVAALALGACSPVEKRVDPVGTEELTAEVTAILERELNVPFEVECTQELPAEVGATATCQMTSPATSEGDVTVVLTVTSVDSETGIVSFDLTAEPAIQPTEPATESVEPTS